MTTAPTSLAAPVPADVAHRLVALATRAPSVHNTQPWRWRVRDDGVELYADPSRRLEAADPLGRNLVISCGAALHHLRIAAGAHGWASDVERLPDPSHPTWLARARLFPATVSPTAEGDLAAIHDRCTDRRRFTSWPVPEGRLRTLAAVATEEGGHAVPLTEVHDRFRVDLLASRAQRVQDRDANIQAEAQRWIDRNAVEGIPSAHLPTSASAAGTQPRCFAPGSPDVEDVGIESGDGLIVLYDTEDTTAAWLRAGESLSALWLSATVDGLSVVPLSQIVEVAETREALRHQVFGGLAVPLILVRIGWQAIGRSQLRPTPRRPLEEVLVT